MSRTTLTEFFDEFIEQHASASGDETLLDVSSAEVEALGLFFVRAICGWMKELHDRRFPRLPTSSGELELLSPEEEKASDEVADAEADASPVSRLM